jgi:hypothetical protein
MASIKVRPTNGVSYGATRTVTAGDTSDGYVEFDFRMGSSSYRYALTAVVQVLNASNVVTMPANLAITFPSNGLVRATGTLVTGSIINVIAQRVYA